MEFLVLAPTPTWPNDLGSRKGIVSLHKKLQQRGRIHYVLYAAEGEWRDGFDEGVLEGMRGQWDTLHVIGPTRPCHTHAIGVDHKADEWWDDAIGHYLTWRFARSQFDAFVVHYTWLSKALTFATKPVHKVLYTADRFAGRRELFEQRGFKKEFFHLDIEGERQAISRADTVIAVKEQEQAFFESICTKTVITVPHYEPRLDVSELPTGKVLKIGLIGGFNTINSENLREFLKVAEPIFARYFAPLEILVAGGMCEGLRDFHSPYIKQLGYIEDITTFYSAVDVVIVPMIWSSGIKIKFAEAVAASKPTLSTAHAAEGYPTPHPWMACEDFKTLAMACVSISFDRQLLVPLQAASEKAWEQVSTRFDDSVLRLVDIIRSRTPKYVIIAPRQIGDVNSYEFRRLWDVLDYTRGTIKCDIIVPSELSRQSTAFRKLKSAACVFEVDDMDAAFDDANGAVVLGWYEPVAGRLRRFTGDILSFSEPEKSLFDASVYARQNRQAMLTYFGNKNDMSWTSRSGPHVSTIDCPYFWRDAGEVAKRWAEQAPHQNLIHVVVDERTKALGSALGAVVKQWAPTARVEFIQAEEDQVARFSRISLAGPRPQLVVDLAPISLRDVHEIYERAGIPVLSCHIGSSRLRKRTKAAFPPSLRARSYGEICEVLNVALSDPTGFELYDRAANARANYKFAADVGWTIYWRFINSVVDCARLGLFQ